MVNPNSVRLICPYSVNKIFSGFRSLYTIFNYWCKYSDAKIISAIRNLTIFSDNPPFFFKILCKSPTDICLFYYYSKFTPLQSSILMKFKRHTLILLEMNILFIILLQTFLKNWLFLSYGLLKFIFLILSSHIFNHYLFS